MTGVIAVLLVFGGLIFFHELGHFLVARFFNIGVKVFSLGFGPVVFSRMRGKTTYQIAAVPLGGYVALVGETSDAEIPAPFTAADSFSLHPAWQRFFVAAAGSVFNLLLAWLICWGMLFSYGKQELLPVLGEVQANTPAAATLAKGDILQKINGLTISRWYEIPLFVTQSQGRPVNLEFTRAGEKRTTVIIPERRTQKDLLGRSVENWIIGVGPSGEAHSRSLGFFEAAGEGVKKTRDMIALTWEIVAGLFNRTVAADNLGGPIGIVQMIYTQTDAGIIPLLSLMAFLSINLGILNLLPIPVLDGGHLLFLTLEMLFKRPVPLKIQERAMVGGLTLLLGLMLFATYNDLARIFKQFFL